MQGRRLPDNAFYNRLNGHGPLRWLLHRPVVRPGDYGRCAKPREEGIVQWWFMSPNGLIGRLATQAEPDGKGRHHEVEEHEDGSISVIPRPNNSNSIMVHGYDGERMCEWHGFIRHGVWESV